MSLSFNGSEAVVVVRHVEDFSFDIGHSCDGLHSASDGQYVDQKV
jgi:hypothetical protein